MQMSLQIRMKEAGRKWPHHRYSDSIDVKFLEGKSTEAGSRGGLQRRRRRKESGRVMARRNGASGGDESSLALQPL